MSLAAPPTGLIAQAKRQPGKTAVLGILVLLMAVVWGRALLGGEDSKSKPKSRSKSTPPVASAAPASKPAKNRTVTAAEPTTKAGSISNFATAISRIEAWRKPLGFEKAEPLTEELLAARRAEAEAERRALQDRTDAARQAGAAAAADREGSRLLNGGEADTAPEPPEALATPLTVDADLEVDLTLTGTMVFGDTRFALFGDTRVQEGQRFGRYLVKAVRPREVDLVVDGTLTVVRIAPPDLGGDS